MILPTELYKLINEYAIHPYFYNVIKSMTKKECEKWDISSQYNEPQLLNPLTSSLSVFLRGPFNTELLNNMSQLRSLRILYSHMNPVPDFNLPYLNLLRISGCDITSVPNFSNLHYLSILYLDDNKLATIPDFDKLSSINQICFNANPITIEPLFTHIMASGKYMCYKTYITRLP